MYFVLVSDYDYFEGRPRDPIAEHRRRLNLQIHERYRIRDNNNPLDLSLTEFVKLYRMPQDAVVNLANILRPYLPQNRSPQQIPVLRKVSLLLFYSWSFSCMFTFSHTWMFLQVLIALSFYACGSYQRMMGRSIDIAVGQTSVSRMVREVTMALNHPQVLSQFIRFPMTHQERAETIRM